MSKDIIYQMKIDIATEGFELLDEYGLQAFLDLTATSHDPIKGIRTLNKMKDYFIKEEDYRKCAKIQDCINLLWVDRPEKQGLKKELGILN